MPKLASGIVRFSKQKLIPALVVDVLGPFCSVRLSGTGKQITGLKYAGPIPIRGQKVTVNYQTGTPYVQTQALPEAELPPNPDFSLSPSGVTVPPPIPVITFSPTYTWNPSAPAIGGIPGPRMSVTRTVVRIDAGCVSGTSVTFNIEKRSVYGTPGVDIMASDLVAGTSGTYQTAFADAILGIGDWLWLDISGVSGIVTDFVATITVT
jgi:hypothetical protein